MHNQPSNEQFGPDELLQVVPAADQAGFPPCVLRANLRRASALYRNFEHDPALTRRLAGEGCTMLGEGLERGWAHICVDMQSLFAQETDWHAPWLKRILPAVEALAARTAQRTVFTRFIPPETLDNAHGAWRGYYERWPRMVRRHLSPELLNIVPSLAQFAPPAHVLDKTVYSPWLSGKLHDALRSRGVSTLVVSGGETDVCVLATVMGAIDLGYHVVLPTDALFGSADATHDAMLEIYRSRFQTQLTITKVDDLLQACRDMGA